MVKLRPKSECVSAKKTKRVAGDFYDFCYKIINLVKLISVKRLFGKWKHPSLNTVI